MWRNPNELKKLNNDKKICIEEEEQTLALEELKLALREQAAKVHSLELCNKQIENELNL